MDFDIWNKEYCKRFIVTKNVYDAFQACSKDMNPMHVSDEYAQRRGYDQRIMYGNILNAYVSFFVGMMLPTQSVIILSQEIAYHKPVYMNDELEFRAELTNFSEAVGVAEFKYKFLKANKPIAKGGGN